MERTFIATPNIPSYGGPKSFFDKLNAELSSNHNIEINNDPDQSSKLIFVIGGTKRFFWLLKQKIKGKKIIQRLNGVNNYDFKSANLKDYINAKIGNFLIFYVRNFFANHIIYQSYFSKEMNDKAFGQVKTPYSIIYNGTKTKKALKNYSKRPINLFCCEGTIENDIFDQTLLKEIMEYVENNSALDSFHIFGLCKQEDILQKEVSNYRKTMFHGKVPFAEIEKKYQEGGIFFSIEIDSACPNSVIEAISFRLPIAGFITGAMPELVKIGKTGVLNKKISKNTLRNNPFVMHQAIDSVKATLDEIIKNYETYETHLQDEFFSKFNIEDTAAEYLKVFEKYI